MHIGYWWEIQKKSDHSERPVLRWVDNIKIDLREIGWEGMNSTDLSHKMLGSS
jgi:hypothetical protein